MEPEILTPQIMMTLKETLLITFALISGTANVVFGLLWVSFCKPTKNTLTEHTTDLVHLIAFREVAEERDEKYQLDISGVRDSIGVLSKETSTELRALRSSMEGRFKATESRLDQMIGQMR